MWGNVASVSLEEISRSHVDLRGFPAEVNELRDTRTPTHSLTHTLRDSPFIFQCEF